MIPDIRYSRYFIRHDANRAFLDQGVTESPPGLFSAFPLVALHRKSERGLSPACQPCDVSTVLALEEIQGQVPLVRTFISRTLLDTEWHVDSHYTLMSVTQLASVACCVACGLWLVTNSSMGHTAWLWFPHLAGLELTTPKPQAFTYNRWIQIGLERSQIFLLDWIIR